MVTGPISTVTVKPLSYAAGRLIATLLVVRRLRAHDRQSYTVAYSSFTTSDQKNFRRIQTYIHRSPRCPAMSQQLQRCSTQSLGTAVLIMLTHRRLVTPLQVCHWLHKRTTFFVASLLLMRGGTRCRPLQLQ